jgi:hypothetical protein
MKNDVVFLLLSLLFVYVFPPLLFMTLLLFIGTKDLCWAHERVLKLKAPRDTILHLFFFNCEQCIFVACTVHYPCWFALQRCCMVLNSSTWHLISPNERISFVRYLQHVGTYGGHVFALGDKATSFVWWLIVLVPFGVFVHIVLLCWPNISQDIVLYVHASCSPYWVF